MSTRESQGREGGFPAVLRRAALIAVLAGASVSLGLMLLAGHRNPSRQLIAVFGLWVLSPFLALVGAYRVSSRWSVPTRTVLHCVMLVVPLASLAVYGAFVVGSLEAKTGFLFLVFPGASWLLMAVVVAMAPVVSGRVSRPGDDA